MSTEAERELKLAQEQWEAYCDHVEQADLLDYQIRTAFQNMLERAINSDDRVMLAHRLILSISSAALDEQLSTGAMATILEWYVNDWEGVDE